MWPTIIHRNGHWKAAAIHCGCPLTEKLRPECVAPSRCPTSHEAQFCCRELLASCLLTFRGHSNPASGLVLCVFWLLWTVYELISLQRGSRPSPSCPGEALESLQVPSAARCPGSFLTACYDWSQGLCNQGWSAVHHLRMQQSFHLTWEPSSDIP